MSRQPVDATLNKDSNTAGSFGTWFELFHHPSISNTNNKSIYVLAQNLVQRKYSKHTPAHKYRHPHTWEYYTHWLDTIHSQPTLWTTNRDLRSGKQQQSRKYGRSIGSQKQTSHTHTLALKKNYKWGRGVRWCAGFSKFPSYQNILKYLLSTIPAEVT